ncbi:hypothetical protein PF010_g4161 [Phytophthora fragariae]|uniref:Uncharacterized protein n=2 Tax=Phytophthora TaxID=4783 RepID=A0A6A3TCI5_9STRA|nr:hypothetical protein PF003_g23452 [Phytophthora fragariae]KAE9129528.1 hypothetical protein PF010_g4161 [Phytophthora fragariae]KAE9133696.1 hypothetical protein PF007_g3246 [Phytophthora fragariae]KAE9352051.1 hypothetical protein PF008_g5649 [Phytophthora fragariae]KAE9355541.1 hypothetical protein PR003_g2798 [Phytophthora rubi]
MVLVAVALAARLRLETGARHRMDVQLVLRAVVDLHPALTIEARLQ